MYEFHTEKEIYQPLPSRKIRWKVIGALFIGLIAFIIFMSAISAPKNFPTDQIITIEQGSNLDQIARQFEEAQIIKSVGLFKTFVLAIASDRSILDGDYLFNRRLNAWQIAERIAFGRFGVEKIKITLFEGLSNREMSEILVKKLPNFNQEEFLYLTKSLEGYLFPDTYYFFGSATAADVIREMRDSFKKKVSVGLAEEIEKSGKSIEEILTMASIIQDEAYDGYEEKQMISGILWKRIDKNMLLQVDATLRYFTNKPSSKLTLDDLATDNPYNTYVYKGLPPTPIGNPGVDAIRAAMNPKDSPYLFYLHDKNANIHYAKDYNQHKANIAKYLK